MFVDLITAIFLELLELKNLDILLSATYFIPLTLPREFISPVVGRVNYEFLDNIYSSLVLMFLSLPFLLNNASL